MEKGAATFTVDLEASGDPGKLRVFLGVRSFGPDP
jgi:hypothetical protein